MLVAIFAVPNWPPKYAHFISMNVQLRYNSTTHSLSLPVDANVSVLQNEVYKMLEVPPEQQKLIFRGRPITEPERGLQDLQIKNGAKLLLLATAAVSAAVASESSPYARLGARKIQMPPNAVQIDEAIVVLGPPEGAIQGFAAETTALPKAPFVVRCDHGVSEMSLETDALFLRHENGVDRIFLSDITRFGSRPIGDGKYVMFSVETRQNHRVDIYFVPTQYRDVILRFLRGGDMESYGYPLLP